MEKQKMLYEGKAKKIFETNDEKYVIVHYKDDTTAFNGEKKDTVLDKGILNNEISTLIFTLLEKNGIETHFIKKLNEREQICRKVEIIPLEVIVRNVAAGSMAKRLALNEGFELKTTVLELSYKDDDLGDPLINDHHAVGIGITTFDELNKIYDITKRINNIMIEFFKNVGIKLIDFKLEFGKQDGKIYLADEISPDTCRFWDIETGEKLDKDRFRRDLGNVKEAYQEILKRLETNN